MGVEGDFISWYDASEISAEVLYLLAKYRLKTHLKVTREHSTRKR